MRSKMDISEATPRQCHHNETCAAPSHFSKRSPLRLLASLASDEIIVFSWFSFVVLGSLAGLAQRLRPMERAQAHAARAAARPRSRRPSCDRSALGRELPPRATTQPFFRSLAFARQLFPPRNLRPLPSRGPAGPDSRFQTRLCRLSLNMRRSDPSAAQRVRADREHLIVRTWLSPHYPSPYTQHRPPRLAPASRAPF